jgi:hypothetical protein
MSYRNMLPLLALLGAALAGCNDSRQVALSDRPLPPANWISPAPVHSTPTSGSVSDAASGSTVIDDDEQH